MSAFVMTPYATGGYDGLGTYFGGNVASITSFGGSAESEFFAFNISGLSGNQEYYTSPVYQFTETLYYMPSTSDPFDTHTIYIDYAIVSQSLAESIVSGTAGKDFVTNYNDTLNNQIASVDVRAGIGIISPSLNNNVSKSASVSSMLADASQHPGDVLMLYASEASGGISNVSNVFITAVNCFTAGTRLLARQGEVAVEDLREGDHIVTLTDGRRSLRPVIWVGDRTIDLKAHPEPHLAAPIRIRRHAIADNVPHRDLLVSPDHAIHVDGALIAARRLVNGASIVQEIDCASVRYLHIECDEHVLLVAEGVPAESYQASGGDSVFARPGKAQNLHPRFVDEPPATAEAAILNRLAPDAAITENESAADNQASGGTAGPVAVTCAAPGRPLPAVRPEDAEPIWRRLAERAERHADAAADTARYAAPATAETTSDPVLGLLVAGRFIAPVVAGPQRYVFVLPRGASSAHLVSRTVTPAAMQPWLDDRRRLGVSVRRIVLRGAHGVHEVPIDHPDLAAGWWAVERSGAARWRWTNGCAALPLREGVALVEVHVDAAIAYPLEGERVAA